MKIVTRSMAGDMTLRADKYVNALFDIFGKDPIERHKAAVTVTTEYFSGAWFMLNHAIIYELIINYHFPHLSL